MDGPSLFTGTESDDGTFVPFTDILFNVLLGFTMMVFVAFALIRPDAKSGIIDTNAEFIITTTWPDSPGASLGGPAAQPSAAGLRSSSPGPSVT